MPLQNHEVNMVDLLNTLSMGLDFTLDQIDTHHRRVTAVALYLGHAAGLDELKLEQLYKSAIIHDIGVITLQEKQALHIFDVEDTWNHCYKGAYLVRDIEDMETTSEILLSHHDWWQGRNNSGLYKSSIPLLSRIIHLADRLDVLIQPGKYILEQREGIIGKLSALSGTVFDPDLVHLLIVLSKNESFWFDITSPWIDSCLMSMIPDALKTAKMKNLNNIGQLFARAVDVRSPFTYRHSYYVAAVCYILAEQYGLSNDHCHWLETAGFLHDIGKLAIPEDILEKPGKLTREEYEIVKKHPYYTYRLLTSIAPKIPAAKWAAYHHERLDGSGYPFRIGASKLDIESRIVAVADVFTALREDRPYRKGLNWSAIAPIMNEAVHSGALDGEIVSLLYSSKADLDTYWDKTSTIYRETGSVFTSLADTSGGLG